MGEKLPTRREADSKNFEKSEKYQAISTLTKYGLLMKVSDLELYHGRNGEDQNWKVEPGFDNSDNNTGHNNVNKISALNTSHLKTAREFAENRAYDEGGIPKVHRIMSDDPDASVFNMYFSFDNLDKNEQETIFSAIRKTLPGITAGAPLDFAHRDTLKGISPNDFVKDDTTNLTYEEDLVKNAEKFHFDKDFNRKIVSARNTSYLLRSQPDLAKTLLIAFLDNKDSIKVSVSGKEHKLPISREYLASWLREIHVIGCKVNVDSATLGKTIEDFILFDLEKINTHSEIKNREKKANKRLGQIALKAEKRHSGGKLAETLAKDLYIKPQEIISLAKETPGYKEIFEADAGNWEGFTLEQHTETVLRLFEKNYADMLPASLLPIMRLALLVHDIGKPKAVENHDKEHQKLYNLKYAEDFMEKNSVKSANRKLVLAMIGEGLELTGRYLFKEDQRANENLDGFCRKTLRKYLGQFIIDRETITGFRRMLEILQMCDSAAYTSMGTTRSKGVYYKNNDSFGKSFRKPNLYKPNKRPRVDKKN